MIARNNVDAETEARAWLLAQSTGLFDIIACQDEASWLAERNNGIGASEVAVLLGLSDWASPFSLWAQKTGKIEVERSDADWLEWGRYMEEPTARRYADRTQRGLLDLGRFTLLRSKQWPWLFCTLDRIIHSLPATGIGAEMFPVEPWMQGPGALEIKAPTIYGYRNWDEGVPLDYQAQHQTQLAVTGWSWGSFAAQMPTGSFRAVDVQRDEEFIALLVEKSKAFYDCMVNNTWPPIDGSEHTGSALRQMFKALSADAIELPAEAEAWYAELEQAREQEKLAKSHIEEMKNNFMAVLQGSARGNLKDGRSVSLSVEHRDQYMVKAHTRHVLRTHEPKKLRRSK